MRRLSALFAVVLVFGAVRAARAEKPVSPDKIRVVLTYGGHDFAEKPFFAMFDRLAEVRYKKAPLPESAALLQPDLRKTCDVLVMYDMIGRITPQQQRDFIALLERGIGVVSLHHNLGAHSGWDEFAKIIGGRYLRQSKTVQGKTYGPSAYEHDQTIHVTVADRQHPITRGLGDFTIHDETYCHYFVDPGVHVLLCTNHPKNDANISWVKEYGASRVFYLMLGHDDQAWSHPAYPQLLDRAIHWAAGRLR
ncbi:MAG: ThuA domain-containing protein [Thermoguttaceae bacterium]|jgi:type 1 glutamine amidotransferase